jgi:hypothetical protein
MPGHSGGASRRLRGLGICVWCGRSTITEPSFLMAQVKNAPDLIDALEKQLTCSSCQRAGVRIIPTDRQIVSFDRMGTNRR